MNIGNFRQPATLHHCSSRRPANVITDSRFFIRPFTSLGFNAHFQAGTRFDLWKFFTVGASAYDILPSGQQTIFRKVVGQQSGSSSSSPSHGRVFENNQEIKGSADIARDNGYSAWLDARPTPSFDLNTVSFNVGVNLGHLARKRAGR